MAGWHLRTIGNVDDNNPSAAGFVEVGTDKQAIPPLRLYSAGTIGFGDGTSVPDTVLARSAAGQLAVNGNPIGPDGSGNQTVSGTLTVAGGISQTSGAASNSFAGALQTAALTCLGLLTAAAGVVLNANTGDLTVSDGSGGIVGKIKPRVNTPTFNAGGTTTPNAAAADICQVTMTGNTTFGAPTDANVVAGQRLLMRVRQDATGGRTAAWNAIYRFPSGQTPILSAGANKTDYLAFAYNATDSKWDLVYASQNV